MLETKVGDVFVGMDPPCMLVQGCNAQGTMGSGFALKVKRRWPEVFLAYANAHREDGLRVGEVIFVVCGDTHIANAITQQYYGRDPETVYVDYAGLEKALHQVAQYAKINQLPIHLPLIGGGLARGDSARLIDIYTRCFDSVSATLWLSPPPKGHRTSWPLRPSSRSPS